MTPPGNASQETVQLSASGEPSIDAVIAELRRLSRAQWLDMVRSDQSHRWRRRTGVAAEEYFHRLPELRDEAEDALVVINGEIMLRTELGESPELAEYERRFPELGERIAVQFEVNRALAGASDDSGGSEFDELFDSAPAIDLPGYVFLEEVGVGSCGVVYRARQQSLGRDVAVKVVRTIGADAKQVARQRQEAEILGRLQHPNVVHIYEVLQSRGMLYLVMEFVAGTTLARRINGRPLAPLKAAQLATTLARTVHVVHEAGVLHRDLKPSNILLTPTQDVKITDFGLAKLQSQSNSLTAPDSIVGTPSYMAPEQAGGDPRATDARADVYSLGAILYELLSGRPPFLGATVLDTLSLIRSEEPVPLRRLLPRLPRDLETICLKCLAKAPQQRYDTAAALGDDLDRYLEGAPIAARRPGPVERLWRAAKRRPAIATAAAGVLAAAVVAATAWRMHQLQQRRQADAALVESIATADAQVLPQLLNRLPRDEPEVLGRLRTALARVRPPDSRWVNLAIAQATADSSASRDELFGYLPSARPVEIPLLVSTLAIHPRAVIERAWAQLLNETATDEARLRVACVAAHVSPADSRWKAAGPAVARALVWQHPVDIGTFTAALRPVGAELVPALAAVYRDHELEPVSREVAAGILAQFAADRPTTLADLIVEADPSEFRLLLPALAKYAPKAVERLSKVAAQRVDIEHLARAQLSETRHVVETQFDVAQRRRAVALVALWRLGREDAAVAALGRNADPALRAWLVETLGPLGVPAGALVSRAWEEDDPAVQQSLLLAIGQAPLQGLTASKRMRLTAGVLATYRDDGDAGVHSACRWLLVNRFDASAELAEADASLPVGVQANRDWYVGANGHTYSVLRGPLEFTMGSPPQELSREDDETAHAVQLDYSLAIGAQEVTVAQFLRFREKYFNRRYSATDDCPANNITWFDAAAYCRWLSEQEGLPEGQMCFPPVEEIGPGMRLPANWRQRTGYRLPTEAEWEYACRGGVQGSRYPGEGKQLLGRYAWFIENSDDHAWPVGRLKPNKFGLFDMLGNVTERCFDRFAPYADGAASGGTPADEQGDLIIDETTLRSFRGANFGDAEHNLRSARRNANLTTDQWALIGFRPVRVIRP